MNVIEEHSYEHSRIIKIEHGSIRRPIVRPEKKNQSALTLANAEFVNFLFFFISNRSEKQNTTHICLLSQLLRITWYIQFHSSDMEPYGALVIYTLSQSKPSLRCDLRLRIYIYIYTHTFLANAVHQLRDLMRRYADES